MSNTFKRVISTTAPTSTGTVDYTVAGLGASTHIKGVEVEVARAVTLGTDTDGRSGCRGFSDGTTEAVLSWSSEHGVTTTDTYTYSAQDKVVALMDPADGSLEAVATFDSFITDGVRLNWTTAPSSAYRVAVVITAGPDVECDVQIVDPADALSGTVTVTPGYTAETNLVLALAGTISTAFDGTLESSSSVSWGACSNDGTTVTQNAEAWSYQDAVSTTLDSGILHLNRLASHVSATALGVSYAASGFNASTGAFTLTTAGASATSAERIAVMMFHMPSNIAVKVYSHSFTSTVGTQSFTDPGFQPQYIWYGLSLFNATNTVRTNAQAGSYGSGHADEAGVEWCGSYADRDNRTTSDTQSLVDEVAIELPLHAGGAGYTGTVDSWDATGYTINFTSVVGTSRFHIGYAIEQEDSLYDQVDDSSTASDAVLGSIFAVVADEGATADDAVLGGIFAVVVDESSSAGDVVQGALIHIASVSETETAVDVVSGVILSGAVVDLISEYGSASDAAAHLLFIPVIRESAAPQATTGDKYVWLTVGERKFAVGYRPTAPWITDQPGFAQAVASFAQGPLVQNRFAVSKDTASVADTNDWLLT